MKCPNCNETLLMTERQMVEIDYCPNCRGVWLDRGELDKLLEVASEQKNTISPQKEKGYEERGDRYSNQNDGKKYEQQYPRKKKSFLSDFFDFD
ncbi:zf-TFIIB domain-containing protein [Niabella sp. CC-SYL272]|uniref:TFIIB-type zinc ribbon-containing protein n=1 Tax=Niabella agricola TaxID=2891571 RepID=UPI001F1A6FF1|nr:zf-TFIIB domain-containing protein [Niabella agricola]MCF3108012.1 zf-TFIIB domain-containing protein [Niabella agricola]